MSKFFILNNSSDLHRARYGKKFSAPVLGPANRVDAKYSWYSFSRTVEFIIHRGPLEGILKKGDWQEWWYLSLLQERQSGWKIRKS